MSRIRLATRPLATLLLFAVGPTLDAQAVFTNSTVDGFHAGTSIPAYARASGSFASSTDSLQVDLEVFGASSLPASISAVYVKEHDLSGSTDTVLTMTSTSPTSFTGARILTTSEAASFYREDLFYEVWTTGGTAPDLSGTLRLPTSASARPTPTGGAPLPPGTFTNALFELDTSGPSNSLSYSAEALGFGTPPTAAFLRVAGGGPTVLNLAPVGGGVFDGTLSSPTDQLVGAVLGGALELVMVGAGAGPAPAAGIGPGLGQLVGDVGIGILNGSNDVISSSLGGSLDLRIDAGAGNAGQVFLVLGSASGTAPGIPLGTFQTLPLNPDAYFAHTLNNPNGVPFQVSLGLLDDQGHGEARFFMPPGVAPPQTYDLNHAAVILSPVTGKVRRVSNAVPLKLVPRARPLPDLRA